MQTNPLTPIIVAGSHRSGTTLFRRLLNGHSRIYCGPEVKFHKDLLGHFTDDPLAFGRLGASMNGLGLSLETWLDEFGRAYVRCLEKAAASAGKQRWADKNPDNSLNMQHWHRLLNGELRYILVLRHPFDIVASIAEIQMPRVIPTDLPSRAAHVKQYIEAGLDYHLNHAESSKILHYEALVEKPAEQLEPLLEWLGETFEPSMLEKLDDASQGAGLEDPKAKGRKTISTENVERWRRDFSPEELTQLRKLLGPLCTQLGYPID